MVKEPTGAGLRSGGSRTRLAERPAGLFSLNSLFSQLRTGNEPPRTRPGHPPAPTHDKNECTQHQPVPGPVSTTREKSKDEKKESNGVGPFVPAQTCERS